MCRNAAGKRSQALGTFSELSGRAPERPGIASGPSGCSPGLPSHGAAPFDLPFMMQLQSSLQNLMTRSGGLLALLAVLAPAPSLLAAPAPPACPPIEGLAPLLAAGHGLLLGEMYGTVESPAFLANVVCLAIQAGRPVTVALEIPFQEEARITAYLGSAGAAADRKALLGGPFWQDAYQDGRRSEAMLALLESLRRLRRSRRPGPPGPRSLSSSSIPRPRPRRATGPWRSA